MDIEVKPCPFCGAKMLYDTHLVRFGEFAGQHIEWYGHPKRTGCILDGIEVAPTEMLAWNARAGEEMRNG